MAVYELTLCFYALLLIKASSPPLCSRILAIVMWFSLGHQLQLQAYVLCSD